MSLTREYEGNNDELTARGMADPSSTDLDWWNAKDVTRLNSDMKVATDQRDACNISTERKKVVGRETVRRPKGNGTYFESEACIAPGQF